MNKNRQKNRIVAFFLVFFCFFFLFSVSAQEKKEKEMSYWIKGGFGYTSSFCHWDKSRGIINEQLFETSNITQGSFTLGVEIKRGKTNIEFGINRILIGQTINSDCGVFGDYVLTPWTEVDRVMTYSLRVGHSIYENNYFSIAPKLGFMLYHREVWINKNPATKGNIGDCAIYNTPSNFYKYNPNFQIGIDFRFWENNQASWALTPMFSRGIRKSSEQVYALLGSGGKWYSHYVVNYDSFLGILLQFRVKLF